MLLQSGEQVHMRLILHIWMEASTWILNVTVQLTIWRQDDRGDKIWCAMLGFDSSDGKSCDYLRGRYSMT